MKYGVILKVYNTISEYYNQTPCETMPFISERLARQAANNFQCFTYDIEII